VDWGSGQTEPLLGPGQRLLICAASLPQPADTETSALKPDGGPMLGGASSTITRADVERFRRRALECRAEAKIEFKPVRRQEREETALAYERMAARAERYVAPDNAPNAASPTRS